MAPVPSTVHVRMLQVGFGDSFLVSLGYPDTLDDGRNERHILIDFGSTRGSEGDVTLLDVAHLIAEHCHGTLDAIVVTHRHKDHLSGFGVDSTAEVIDGLHPRLIVRSWTEDPNADEDGTDLADGSRSFVRGLREGQAFATELSTALAAPGRGLQANLARLALDQVANAEAVQRLDGWASITSSSYVSYGSESGIDDLVPGIKVRVLGPPTLEQHPAIARQRSADPDEFWMLYRGLFRSAVTSGAAEIAAATDTAEASARLEPGPARWLAQHLDRQRISSFLRIVRILDDVLNNTSVILLFEIGERRLLLPGDAQIENWEYALKVAPEASENLKLLRRVDLYKVGHHGSRNATPRTLFGLWAEGSRATRPMTALMSTLSGVHGESEATRVPRSTLVQALSERMSLHSTEDLGDDEALVDVAADTGGARAFALASP
jgi:beta-lactamase superfamily II metal-dependent hydrolase